jgi:hypothetical protein
MSQQRHITPGQSLLCGLVVIALGAWAALASWLLGSDGSWEWTADRIVLAVLPGAAAALGGLGMIGARPGSVRLAGLVALAGGLWFMVAAMTSVFWAVGTPALGGHELRMLQWIVFYLGTGAMITLLSCYTLGFLDAPAITEKAVEQAAAVRSRAPAACEPLRRPGAVERWAARRKRVHAGGRTHAHPGNDPAP